MKKVLIFRHAKSDWNADYGHDHERPLSKRGRNAAKVMGQVLARSGPLPDTIFCSSAVRTRTTVERAIEEGGWFGSELHIRDELYGTTPYGVLNLIKAESENAQVVMIVGHEPTCSETVGRFIGEAWVRFPTAALACIQFEADHWSDVEFGQGQLLWLLPPRLFPG